MKCSQTTNHNEHDCVGLLMWYRLQMEHQHIPQ